MTEAKLSDFHNAIRTPFRQRQIAMIVKLSQSVKRYPISTTRSAAPFRQRKIAMIVKLPQSAKR
jgi:hypothetical protein